MAVIISVLYGLFIPWQIMSLSYNTMCCMGVYLLSILTIYKTKHTNIKYISMGILLAIVVLCNPYMISLYLLYLIVTVIFKIKSYESNLFNLKSFLKVTLGAGSIFIVFCCFILSRTTIEKIIACIPYFSTDTRHRPIGLWSAITPVFNFIWTYKYYAFVGGVLFLVGIFYQKKRYLIFQLMVIVTALQTIYYALFRMEVAGFNQIMFPLTPLGIGAFIYSKKKDYKRLAAALVIPCIYLLCINEASSNNFLGFYIALTTSSVFSLYFIKEYYQENRLELKRIASVVLVFLLVAQIFSELYVNANHVFFENGPESLTETITSGPDKGLITSKENKEFYDINYQNLQSIKDAEGKNVLFYNHLVKGYFMLENSSVGAFSAWLCDNVSALDDEKMKAYYKINPEKIPDYVYIDNRTEKTKTSFYWNSLGDKYSYGIKRFQNGGLLYYKR